MDDPGSLNYYNQQYTSNPALQGTSEYKEQKPEDVLTPEQLQRWNAYSQIVNQAGPDKYRSYVPADQALREEFMGKTDASRQHFGAVEQGPYGAQQALYTDPKKPSFSAKYMPLVFGGALAAITGGAAAPLLGGLFSAATQYGQGGKFNPMSLGGTALGMINPALGQAYGIGNAAYQASKGNLGPGANLAGNYAWNQFMGG